jgi:TonB family protein
MKPVLNKTCLLFLVLGWAVPPPAIAFQGPDPNSLATQLIALIGFPAKDQPQAGSAVLVPGNVILLDPVTASDRQEALKTTLSRVKVIENLWATFRLDPLRREEKSMRTALLPGKSVDVAPAEGLPVRITTTLLSLDERIATYRVVIKSGEKALADSTANIALGGRAVFGGKDGEVAPYIFLIVQPAKSKGWDGITPPRKLQSIPPSYPESARKDKITGIVVIEAVIDENGKVTAIEVLESPDPALSDAATTALRQWLFEPARKQDGTPVAARTTIEFNFKLQ